MALRLRVVHCHQPRNLPALRLRTLVRQPQRPVVPSRRLAYARKPSHRPSGPSGSPVPPKSQVPAPKPPPASRGSSGGTPPPGFWPKVEFFKEYFYGGFAFLAILAAVLWWAAERVPETNRLRIMFYPRWLDERLGYVAERQLLLSTKLVDSTHADDLKLLQGIASRLEKTPGGLKLRISVADDHSPNAFVLPNGRCVVTTGILDLLERDPDMLAVVLAHESAHVRARHAAERMSNTTLISFLLGGSSNTASTVLLELPFSRRQEEEADFIGILSAARACFTPHKAVNVWERMMKLGPQHGMLTLLSSHPSAKDRLSKLTEWQPRAEQERLAYCARQGDVWELKKNKTKSEKN